MEIGYTKDLVNFSSTVQQDALTAAGVNEILTESGPKAFSMRDSLLERLNPGDLVAVASLMVLGGGLLEILRTVHSISTRGADLVALNDGIDSRTSKDFFPIAFTLLTVGTEQKSIAGAIAYKNAKDAGIRTGRKKVLSAQDTQRLLTLLDEGLKPDALAKLFNVSIATVFNIKRRAKKADQ